MLLSLVKSFLYLMLFSVLALLALLYFVPPNLPQEKMREVVAELYTEATGRKAQINGAVELAILPASHLRLRDVVLSDPNDPQAPEHKLQDLTLELSLRRAFSLRVAGAFRARIDDTDIAGTFDLPTLARYNSGRMNTVDLVLTSPFPLAVSGGVRVTEATLMLEDVQVALANTQGGGDLKSESSDTQDTFAGAWHFTAIDVEEVTRTVAALKAAADFFSPSESGQETLAWQETPLDFDWVRVLKADIALTVEKLTYQNTIHTNVNAKLEAGDNKLSFAINPSGLFGGEGTSSVRVDMTDPVPFLHAQVALRGANIGRFLHDVAGLPMEGAGDLALEAQAAGMTPKELISTLKGKGNIGMKDAVLKGVDVTGMAAPTQAAVEKAFYDGSKDTKLTELSATFSATEGMIMNNDLVLKAPPLSLTGKGVFDLVEMSIKYRVAPVLGVEGVGFTTPLLFRGSLLRPTILPDIASIATQGVDEAVLESRPVKTITDTVTDGLKIIPGVKELMRATGGSREVQSDKSQ